MAILNAIRCRQCGKVFVPTHWNNKLCSDECRKIARKISIDRTNAEMRAARQEQLEPKACAVCGKKFTTNQGNKVTCSSACQHIRNLEKMKEFAEGKRVKKKEKPMSIAEFAKKAREMGMSYGQYELHLRMNGKEK